MHLARLTNPETEIFVEFNAVPSESNSKSVDATSNPVEQIDRAKAAITDHISVNAGKFDLDISLSNYDQILESYQLEEEVPDLVREKLDILEGWQDEGAILNYDGHNNIISDIIILDIGDTFAVSTGDSVVLKVSFLKIRLAQALTQELNAPAPVRKTQKKGKVDPKEKEIPAETEAEAVEVKKSWISSIFS